MSPNLNRRPLQTSREPVLGAPFSRIPCSRLRDQSSLPLCRAILGLLPNLQPPAAILLTGCSARGERIMLRNGSAGRWQLRLPRCLASRPATAHPSASATQALGARLRNHRMVDEDRIGSRLHFGPALVDHADLQGRGVGEADERRATQRLISQSRTNSPLLSLARNATMRAIEKRPTWRQ